MCANDILFGYRPVSPEEKRRLVGEQFASIAGRYDLVDTVLSAGRDGYWRRRAISLLGLTPGETVLDLCGGTGGLALLASRRMGDVGRVVICDFSRAMMEAGRAKVGRSPAGGNIHYLQGDAESLALADASVDAVTLGFGLRNFVRAQAGLKEMHRVLKSGGKLLILEFSLPVGRLRRLLYDFYSFRIMPPLARLICGTGGPYRYLAESIRVFPPPAEVASLIGEAGFIDVAFRRLTRGIAVIYTAKKS